jgi:hypothetical protein
MEQSNDSVVYELRLALYNMIRVARGLIDNRGTILSARKRIEEAEKILNKNFNINDVLRSDPSVTLTDYAALQAKCDRYEVALKDLKEYTSSCAEDASYVDHDEIIDRINKALSAGEGEKIEQERTCKVCGKKFMAIADVVCSEECYFNLNQKEDQQ